MAGVNLTMGRVGQPLTAAERNFFRSGDKISAGQLGATEHDHDAWRSPAPRSSIARSIARAVLVLVGFPVAVPLAILRRLRDRRVELDLDPARRVTDPVPRISAAIPRITGALPRLSGAIRRMATAPIDGH